MQIERLELCLSLLETGLSTPDFCSFKTQEYATYIIIRVIAGFGGSEVTFNGTSEAKLHRATLNLYLE